MAPALRSWLLASTLVVTVVANLPPTQVIQPLALAPAEGPNLAAGPVVGAAAPVGAAVPVGAVAPAGTFNAMAAVAAPATAPGTPGLTKVLNAAINGDKTGVKASAQQAINEVAPESGDFTKGFIAAYFAKVVLEEQEKNCIETNAQRMVRDGVGLITQVGEAIAALVARTQPNYMSLMTGAGQIVEIVTTTQALLADCVRSDVMAVMNATLQHLKNPQYEQGRLLANGIDIAGCLADSVQGVEASNFTRVGMDFGKLLRKILLSKNTGYAAMPMPQNMSIGEVGPAVVNGVIAGLFVTGTSMTIKSTTDPSINIFVDLHRCIAKEAKYMSAAMNALYLGIAQLTAQIESMQLRAKGVQAGIVGQPANGLAGAGGLGGGLGDMTWMNSLSGLLVNLPDLMDRCGFNTSQRLMMSSALKSMSTMQMAFVIPGPHDRIQAGDLAAEKFTEATKEWEQGKYLEFGFLLGGLMRDLLLTVYPQQYHVDHGQLSEYVKHTDMQHRVGDVAHNTAGALAIYVGGFAAFMVLGLSVVRAVATGRPSTPLLQADTPMDIEGLE